MALPEFDDAGVLPPGDWEAGWDEIEERFATTFRRKQILAGVKHVVAMLVQHGVRKVWLDGSFATSKMRPRDADVVYQLEPGGDDSDWADVGPSRQKQLKAGHDVDLWRLPSWQLADGVAGTFSPPISIKEYFETDRDGRPRGMIRLRLE